MEKTSNIDRLNRGVVIGQKVIDAKDRKFTNFVDDLTQQYSLDGEEPGVIARKMCYCAAFYSSYMRFPSDEANALMVVNDILKVSRIAQDLKDAVERLGPGAYGVVFGTMMAPWAIPGERYWDGPNFVDTDAWKWICRLAWLSKFYKEASITKPKARKGAPTGHPAEKWLLKTCALLLVPSFPETRTDFPSCVRKMARKIHNTVADKPELTKFKNVSVPSFIDTLLSIKDPQQLDFISILKGI